MQKILIALLIMSVALCSVAQDETDTDSFLLELTGCDNDTGGTCYITDCYGWRNADTAGCGFGTSHKCLCKPGTCAVNKGKKKGKCVATASPTAQPTRTPTAEPTVRPTLTPTDMPTTLPPTTNKPSFAPTATPTHEPTAEPTRAPTQNPTAQPTATPTAVPTVTPTDVPTTLPPTTNKPSFAPTVTPTHDPTAQPTITPTTGAPSKACDNDTGGTCYMTDCYGWRNADTAGCGYYTTNNKCLCKPGTCAVDKGKAKGKCVAMTGAPHGAGEDELEYGKAKEIARAILSIYSGRGEDELEYGKAKEALAKWVGKTYFGDDPRGEDELDEDRRRPKHYGEEDIQDDVEEGSREEGLTTSCLDNSGGHQTCLESTFRPASLKVLCGLGQLTTEVIRKSCKAQGFTCQAPGWSGDKPALLYGLYAYGKCPEEHQV